MGCGGSKPAAGGHKSKAAVQADADRWQRRKKTGFKDSGLERHRQNCVQQKKHLHHVEDPAKAQKKKMAKIQAKNKKTATVGSTGLTQNELQRKRQNLRHVK